MPPFHSSIPIDRGWAWVVMIGAFMNFLILLGIFKCFGILFAELIETYQGTASSTSSMLAVSAGLNFFLAPLVTALSDVFTCRTVSMIGGVLCALGFLVPAFCNLLTQIVISFGILTGLGRGMHLIPCIIIVSQYFNRYRSLANGLMSSGSGVGAMIIPLFLNYIIDLCGVQGAFIVLASMALQSVVFSTFYRPIGYWRKAIRPPMGIEEGNKTELEMAQEKVNGSKLLSDVEDTCTREGRCSASINLRSGQRCCETVRNLLRLLNDAARTFCTPNLFKQGQFVYFAIACAFMYTSVYIEIIVPPYGLELGMTKRQVSLLIASQGAADIAGRLLTAIFGDRSWVRPRRTNMLVLCCLVCSIAVFCSRFVTTFWTLMACLVVSSAAIGSFMATVPVTMVDLVGAENLSRAWGWTTFLEGFVVTLSPLIIGVLRDWTLSYNSGLVFIGSCFTLATVCLLVVAVTQYRPGHRIVLDPVVDDSDE